MPPVSRTILTKIFPKLRRGRFEVTSPEDSNYNCIAWAAGDTARWWEPDPMGAYYWPATARREYSIDAYEEALRSRKSTISLTVALFAQGDRPTHAARQLDDKTWTSKLGKSVDISHSLEDLSGGL